MTIIAEQIKEMMLEKGFTTYALERQAGLKRGAIQNIIYGRSRNPGIEILRPVAQVLECSVSELIGEDTSEPQLHSQPQNSLKMPSWNPELYRKCFETVENLLQKKGLHLPNPKILTYVHEIYLYSVHQKKDVPENYFAQWLVNRFLEKEDL